VNYLVENLESIHVSIEGGEERAEKVNPLTIKKKAEPNLQLEVESNYEQGRVPVTSR